MDASVAKPIAVEISNQLTATTAINKAVSEGCEQPYNFSHVTICLQLSKVGQRRLGHW